MNCLLSGASELPSKDPAIITQDGDFGYWHKRERIFTTVGVHE